ncbi:MAG: hypothetical protein WCI72_05230 [archaeon]
MKLIRKQREMEKLPYGTEIDLGLGFPAYYSNRGTDNGKKWGTPIFWTLRREENSILEEEVWFGTNPQIGTVTVHDKGLSGDYEKLDSWLKGVTAKAF